MGLVNVLYIKKKNLWIIMVVVSLFFIDFFVGIAYTAVSIHL